MDSEFFVLRDSCLGINGLVAHVSFNAFGCIASYTHLYYSAILLRYDEAVLLRDFLLRCRNEFVSIDIIPFSEVSNDV